ncbi:MAG: hypothetical protein JW783_05255 [Bacteroidales bacterium]|nr:hypothetical protein [Bacteroidales bacterium]MBN2749383.1 hypothetical protein [Bacteroidales bacterium]
MKRIPITLVGLALFGLVTSCYDFSKFDNITIDPINTDMAFPVINSSITFKELVERGDENTIVGIYEGTNQFYLTFRDTTEFGLASDRFAIPSQSFSEGVEWPYPSIPLTEAGVEYSYEESFEESFSAIDGAELKSISLSSGSLQINMTNTFSHPVSGNLVFVSLKDIGGTSVVVPFTIEANGFASIPISLANRVLDLHNTSNSTYNSFAYTVSATITTSSTAGIITGQGISVDVSLSNLVFSEIRGAFNYTFDTDYLYTPIDLFSSAYIAEMSLANPKLELTIENGFGVPASMSLFKFEFANRNNDSLVVIQNEGALESNDLKVSLPNDMAPATESSLYGVSSYVLDASNSNIETVFDIAPNQLNYGASFTLGEGMANHDQFVRHDSKINFISNIEVPLEGWATTLVLRDTTENIEWPEIDDLGEVDEQSLDVELRFIFNNGLPLDMNLQILFADDNGNTLTALFEGTELTPFLESAPIGANGEASGKTPNVTTVHVKKAKYDLMADASQMIAVYTVNTGGEEQQNVKILSTNEIDLLLTVRMKGTIKPNK